MGTMDFIIDTISAVHPLYPLISLLKLNGKLITVGLPDKPLELPIFPLVLGKILTVFFATHSSSNSVLISNNVYYFRVHLFFVLLSTGRKLVGGSDIGGMKETQEMLDFCGKHNIASDIELIRMNDINAAMERLAKSDVKYRFVIDVANSLSSSTSD